MHHRISAGVVILLYHRVTQLESDPQWLTVPPIIFDEQIAMLARTWEVLSIDQIAAGLERGSLPKRAVAITFDDGYSDNLHQALPILEKRKAHATFYIASGFVGQSREIFSDELDRLLLMPSRASGVLRLGGRSWDLPALDQVAANWNVLQNPSPTPRHEAYRELCALAAPMNDADRQGLLEAVRNWAGESAEGRASHRFATAEELRHFAASSIATIGAHTVSHPRLSSLSPADQAREIADSKREIERIIDKPVTTFAYPFGGHCDQTIETIDAVRNAGFQTACVNFGGSVRRGDNPLALNRILARDWPAAELQQRIEASFVE